MPAPATTDELFDVIARSGLLSVDALRAYRPPPGRLVSRDAVLARMVRDGVVTPFHAKHLAAGRFRGFFLNEKYKLLAHLGTGGIGQVYLCEHLLLHRLVAVKVLQATAAEESAGAVERFFREARAVAALDDPNIVRVFDMDRAAGNPFMVMEYVDGTNLHAVVAAGGPLSVARAANYVRQAALGLQHAHETGLVHRDVKPGNLLVDRAGVVKLLDLGLARFFSEPAKNNNLTATFDAKSIVGTADFIAPEQTRDSSAVDIRADIYGLGGTLYYLLAGRSPFEHGSVAQKLLWHQTMPPPPMDEFRTGVPTVLLAVLHRMLAKNPNDRYATPADVFDALAPWGAEAIPPPDPSEMPKTSAAAYRLGLSPAPDSGAMAKPAPVTPNNRADETTIFLPTVATPSLEPASGTATSPTLPESPARAAHRSRRWLYAVVGLLLTGNGVALWFALDARARRPDAGSPAAPGEPVTVATGGSTFVQKAMKLWADEYPGPDVRLAPYAAVGSGQGIAGLTAGTYQIGCADAFLTDAELADARRGGRELVHIPLVMGAVVPVYNLPDVAAPIRFNGSALAGIYLGDITRWDHPALKALNLGVELPPLPIQVVFRSDKGGSGTTAIWTEFLHKKGGARWHERMGEPGKAWKAPPAGGVGAEGNEKVADAVNDRFGRIGYVELSFALEKNLPVGAVQNAAGEFVRPSLESVTAAAAAGELRKDLRFSLIDLPGPNTYPITGTTWAIFDEKMPDARRRKAVADFLWWATHDGQRLAGHGNYAPLPPEVVGVIEAKLRPLRE